MNVLSLFSGIGGLDLGLQRAGMTIAGQVEIDPWCRKVLAKHWPEVPRHDDVRTAVDWWRADPRPDVDLICGGVPCQPVSLAGLGLAQDDPRWLWPATISTIGVLRPRFALLENVPGLLVRGMGDVLGHLAEVGYDAEWDCVPASAVGANHRRDRVWIVAYPQGQRHPQLSRITDGQALVGTGARTGSGDCGRNPAEGIPHLGRAASVSAQDVADSSSQRRWIRPGIFGGLGPAKRGWWVTEPAVDRVAYGVPRRVDRLRGLGNAVVPQVAEHVGRLIMEAAA